LFVVVFVFYFFAHLTNRDFQKNATTNQEIKMLFKKLNLTRIVQLALRSWPLNVQNMCEVSEYRYV